MNRNFKNGEVMDNNIPKVQHILIPMDRYPSIREDETISSGVAVLLQHSSSDNQHLHFEEILVINSKNQLAGLLTVKDILTSFFPSILGFTSDSTYSGKKVMFTDLSVLLEDHFRRECKGQATQKVKQYMRKPHRSIDASMHVLHVLEIMIKEHEKTLPVTDNNVLLGAVRMNDIFKVLGTYCTL